MSEIPGLVREKFLKWSNQLNANNEKIIRYEPVPHGDLVKAGIYYAEYRRVIDFAELDINTVSAELGSLICHSSDGRIFLVDTA